MSIEFEKINLIEVVPAIFDWLINYQNWKSPLGFMIAIIIAAVMTYVVAWGMSKFLLILAKIKDSSTTLGIFTSLSGNRRVELKLRQQFCRVMRADLEKIALGENWNDQWFTDLEAEVEAEGRFYASSLHQLFRKLSSGYRKEPSLIKAITRTQESHMLLIGDPGSGKSVALRHLALLLAENGVTSKATKIKVPLYINLREFFVENPENINADTVKDFVLDHVRRGDSSTAQYIRTNWDDFLQRGIWFFLFDSFDEIPAVLHAEKGSSVIAKFSEAIRQFMNGMSECKGLLASREFKGPEAIPWPKLRILPLSNDRQLQLINNAVMDRAQSSVVRGQLATSQSAIYKNPLFLSLLCRYVKEHKTAPKHNYELLMNHVEELANREKDWIEKHCSLKSSELVAGAERIASILAQADDIGLAPTFSELVQALNIFGYNEEQSLNLINALVYVKIGRNDVKEARQGDRRFAFSHRRYQESLFVRYLVGNPGLITPTELLMNSKWREYTVAFLQSQSVETCRPILLLATETIRQLDPSSAVNIDEAFGSQHKYFQWNKNYEIHLLSLLQEGMFHRLKDVPFELSEAIENFVSERWEHGDSYDQRMSIAFGGLVPTQSLEKRIKEALDSRVDELKRASFEKIAFLQSIPLDLATWVRKSIADQTLVAHDLIELSRLDLLVSRLPPELGGQRIFSRNKFLRTLFYKLFKWGIDLLLKAIRFFNVNTGVRTANVTESKVALVAVVALNVGMAIFGISILGIFINWSIWIKFAFAALLVWDVIIQFQLMWRDSEKIITPWYVFLKFLKNGWSGLKIIFNLKMWPLIITGLLIPTFFILSITYVKSLVPISFVLIILAFVVGVFWKAVETRRSLRYLKCVANEVESKVVLYARTNAELLVWLTRESDQVLDSDHTARSLLKILDYLPTEPVRHEKNSPLFSISSGDKFSRHKNVIVQNLLKLAPV